MTDTTAATGTDTNNAGDAPTDSQTVADTTTAQPAAESQKNEAPAVPEAYEFTMPEGVALDKAASDEFSAVAKELKLDQATAQKVADVGIKMAQTLPSVPTTEMKLISTCRARPSRPNVRYSTTKIIRLHR